MSEKIELTLQVADQVQARRQAWREIVAGKLERLEAIDYGTEAISDIRTVARVVARV